MAAAVQNAPAASAEGGNNAAAIVHNSSLYVGDLDREVTEAELFDMFSQVGPVASIRVCRDAVTRRSLGYAYVNYNSSLDPQGAERALETLNYTPINGKPMRIMWSHRDPAFRKSGVGNVFIKNLDKSIDNKALHDTFSAFGEILSCKVANDSNAQSKGYGFVHFEKEESAKLAIEKVNGMLLEDKMVYVGPFKPRGDRPGGDVKFTNVYVKNLDEGVSEEELRKMCEKFGDITSCVIMKDENGKSKGFGFVNFDDVDSAHAAVEYLHGKEINGKEVYAGRAQKKGEREQMLKQKLEESRAERMQKFAGMNLYVKNLVDDIDDDKLRTEFANFGTITSAKVMKDGQTGKSRGFGFVCYTSPEEATKAVTEMNGRMLMGKPVYVALAQRKDVRRQQLEQQYQQRMPPGPMPGPAGGPRGGPGPMGPMAPYGAAPPHMFAYGPGGMPPARPGGMGMYPQMIPRGPMQGGRGPRAMMMQQQGMGMMGGARSGRGGRGGRGGGGRGDGPKGRGGQMQTQWVPQQRGGPRGPGGPQGPGGPPMPAPSPAAAPVPAPAAAPAAPSAVVPGQEGSQLTTAMLAAAAPETQKQMLGERLFPLVSGRQPELAGKITGMLLEMDNTELLLLLESPEALDAKVDEAIAVLRQHGALPEGERPPMPGTEAAAAAAPPAATTAKPTAV